jgi:Secretion system C-terminal sorting domain
MKNTKLVYNFLLFFLLFSTSLFAKKQSGILPEGQKCVYDFTMNVPSCIGTTTTATKTNMLNKRSESSIVISPNPAKSEVNIKYTGLENQTIITIYDLLGRDMARYNVTDAMGNWQLATGSFPTGMYIVVVKKNDVLIRQDKLIIK